MKKAAKDEMQECFIAKVREREKNYHEKLYDTYELFKKGSWLEKPMQEVLQAFAYIDQKKRKKLNVLDLGSGVGRHSIPLAQQIQGNSRVLCVDLLEKSLSKLERNAQTYNVESRIVPVQADVEEYTISENTFDFIVAVSCIEHASSEDVFKRVIQKMIEGTRKGGVHCIIMNTDIQWIDVLSEEEIEPVVELNFKAKEALHILEEKYRDWNIKTCKTKSWRTRGVEKKKDIVFKSTCLCFVAQKV